MKEYSIRPADIYKEYLRLGVEDAQSIFDHSKDINRACPACNHEKNKFAFKKNGFIFVECAECRSLFVNPLPPSEQFEVFYREGMAARYWAEIFVPRVMASRRELVVRPRVKKIIEICNERSINPRIVADIGAGHGIFLEEINNHSLEIYRSLAVEPNNIMAKRCLDQGFEVYEGVGEKAGDIWPGIVNLATCFEVIEHVPLLYELLVSINKMLSPGGIVVITTLTGDGFDVRVLWEEANCICPPSHINFCSLLGLHKLFERAGFCDIDIFTPGELDVDIVRNKLADKNITLSRFEKLLMQSDQKCLSEFQGFLSRNRLSSHCWVIASRK